MSYLTVYGISNDGFLNDLFEYGNSHGGGPVIWEHLCHKYLNGEPWMYTDKLFELAQDPRLEEYESICLKLTFDYASVKSDDLAKVIAALRLFYMDYLERNPTRVNHLQTLANDLMTVNRDVYQGICFHWSSLSSNLWQVREDGDSRLYEFSKDQGHWFLFHKEIPVEQNVESPDHEKLKETQSFRRLVMPGDMNPANRLFGGTLIAWADEAMALYVMCQLSTKRVTTVAISEVIYKKPVFSGDFLEFWCSVQKIGTTSLTVSCQVRRKNVENPDPNDIVTTCAATFVSIDENGKKVQHKLSKEIECQQKNN